jgi:hypothetical protein
MRLLVAANARLDISDYTCITNDELDRATELFTHQYNSGFVPRLSPVLSPIMHATRKAGYTQLVLVWYGVHGYAVAVATDSRLSFNYTSTGRRPRRYTTCNCVIAHYKLALAKSTALLCLLVTL